MLRLHVRYLSETTRLIGKHFFCVLVSIIHVKLVQAMRVLESIPILISLRGTVRGSASSLIALLYLMRKLHSRHSKQYLGPIKSSGAITIVASELLSVLLSSMQLSRVQA